MTEMCKQAAVNLAETAGRWNDARRTGSNYETLGLWNKIYSDTISEKISRQNQ